MGKGQGTIQSAIPLNASDRVLVVAPHPDDELIAAGLLLQAGVVAQASIHVLLVTHGDAFGVMATPRAVMGASSRRLNLGVRRSHESLRALARIGIGPTSVTFLGYPDRGLFALWSDHWRRSDPFTSPFTSVNYAPYENVATPFAPYAGEQLLSDLMYVLERVRPTHLIYPHPKDAHGDHAACSAFVTCALEELALLGHSWVKACQRHLYLVHRGGWPAPRGLNPHREHKPPPAIAALGEVWEEVRADPVHAAQKQAAIAMYRSQFPLVGRFLLSFVGQNEVFARPNYPQVKSVAGGSHVLGATFGRSNVQPIILDPIRDTITRQVERSADVAWVNAVRAGSLLALDIGLARRPVAEVEYRVSLFPSPRREGIHMRIRPPHRASVRLEGMWRPMREVVVRPRDSSLEVGVPLDLLDVHNGLFVSVETRTRGISVDRTGLHYVRVPSRGTSKVNDEATTDAISEAPSLCAVASPADLSACAQIFAECFRESILHLFGRLPPQRLIRQVFRLCYDAEPDALLVALKDGRVQGYVYAPSSLKRVWRTAIRKGHLLRWVIQWLKGHIRLGIAPLRVLLLDKFHFVRSSVGGDLSAEARILSIAVSHAAQSRGIGTSLVTHAMRRFDDMGIHRVRLEVRPWNRPAMRLYEKLGFLPVGKTRDSQGEWVIMIAEM